MIRLAAWSTTAFLLGLYAASQQPPAPQEIVHTLRMAPPRDDYWERLALHTNAAETAISAMNRLRDCELTVAARELDIRRLEATVAARDGTIEGLRETLRYSDRIRDAARKH